MVLTATHTHASAGGFLEHFLYHITSLGFVKQTFDALADGILEVSAVKAASQLLALLHPRSCSHPAVVCALVRHRPPGCARRALRHPPSHAELVRGGAAGGKHQPQSNSIPGQPARGAATLQA